MEEREPLDIPESVNPTPTEVQRMMEKEADMLEQIPMPGVLKGEAARRRKWLTIPRRARIAIRKMHNELGHCPQTVLTNIQRPSKADRDMLEASKCFKCIHCIRNAPAPQTSKVALPKQYVFNFYVGLDASDLHGASGINHSFLNIVCLGT